MDLHLLRLNSMPYLTFTKYSGSSWMFEPLDYEIEVTLLASYGLVRINHTIAMSSFHAYF